MESLVQSVESFIGYYDGIRRRSLNYIRVVPPDRLDWQPGEGEFTCRVLIHHLALTEKLFVGVFVSGKWSYKDFDHEAHHESLDETIALLETMHAEAMASLRTVIDSELDQPRPLLEGPTIKAWRILMMPVEHEIHHRSQLAMYLYLMGVKPPHIYGLGIEDLIARATG